MSAVFASSAQAKTTDSSSKTTSTGHKTMPAHDVSKPSPTFGTSIRDAALKESNGLRSSKWESETFTTSSTRGSSFDACTRDEIYHQGSFLKNVTLPFSHTPTVNYADPESFKALLGSPQHATIGTSKRDDYMVQYNVMRVPFPKLDFPNTDFPKNPMPTVDSRFRAPPSVYLGAGASRADHEKLANPLGVQMAQDMSHIKSTELLDHPKNDSRFHRVRGAEDWSKQATSRDDIHKQANVLGSSTYTSLNPNADWPANLDKQFKSGLGGVIPKAKPEEILKHYNSMKVCVPHAGTSNGNYLKKPISKFDSRYRTQPSFSMGSSKRDDIFKQYNILAASSPVGQTDTVKYVDNAISNSDSRFRSQPTPLFGVSKAQRDDVYKLNNALGVYCPTNATSNATMAGTEAMKYLSTSKHVPSVHMGTATREDIFKQANPLGATIPVDRTPNANFTTKTKSKIDSRFCTAPSATFGVSNRDDALKLVNSLNVPVPKKDASNTPYLLPDDIAGSITRKYARKGKGKWVNHEMGISSRTQHWCEANVLKVPTPFSVHTRDVDYPAEVGFDMSNYSKKTGKEIRIFNSRRRRVAGVTFGKSQREDVNLLRNPTRALHAPHSHRLARQQMSDENVKVKARRPPIPTTKINRRTRGLKFKVCVINDMSDISSFVSFPVLHFKHVIDCLNYLCKE